MNYEQVQTLLSNSPGVKLLRAKNAPLIVSFLYKEFKETHRITIPNYELVDKLADYLEFLGYSEQEVADIDDLTIRAKYYLEVWCSDEQNYLRKYPDERGTDVHELTAYTENVMQWLQDLAQKEFVGTESMFLDIFRKVKELVENSLEDPEQKLTALQKKKTEIEAQIREIEASGVVRAFNDTQIKERFYEINRSAKGLLADFRQVEQNFRDLVRKIYEKYAEKDTKKGEILNYVLDESESLKKSDQGRSFYTFWQVLMDRSRREELDRSIESVYHVLERRQLNASDNFLNNMKFYLLEAGKKVVDSNHLLVEKLNRILSGQSTLERKRAIELIGEIKRYALKVLNEPPNADRFIEIEGSPFIQLLMERPLGEEPQEADFDNHPTEIGSHALENADFKRLLSQFEINKETLLQRISVRLKQRHQVTLAEILNEHPLENGLAELLTYFSIASQSAKHLINDDAYDLIRLQQGTERFVKVPQIIFTQ
ncbi:MAG: DUF3375 domain-containing protein [Candidatus Vecturithrix sp.]|jgi:hypothetical protein|nr:DUF3375 domain-containing protein [Candidatus Vecturithrix sp.]